MCLIMRLGEADDVCFEIENREDQKIKSVAGCSFIIVLGSMLPQDFLYLSSKWWSVCVPLEVCQHGWGG